MLEMDLDIVSLVYLIQDCRIIRKNERNFLLRVNSRCIERNYPKNQLKRLRLRLRMRLRLRLELMK